MALLCQFNIIFKFYILNIMFIFCFEIWNNNSMMLS